MFKHVPRCALLVLATAVSMVVLAPAASADITPTLTLTPSTSAAGATNATLGMDFKFAPSTGDSPKDLTVSLPPGLLDNAAINGGACLVATSPTATCQVASGTITAAGAALPGTIDLVKAASTADIAGLEIVAAGNPVATGEITVRPSGDPAGVGLNLTFANLPALGVSEINVTFTGIRMPASCPATPATVNVLADSQQSATGKTATAPVPVTNCAGLAYAPKLAASATKDAADPGVKIVTAVTQGATESPSRTVALTVPAATFTANLAGAAPLLNSTTPVGSAVAISPLLPGTLTGLVYLVSKPVIGLEIRFPAPVALTLDGAINLGNNSVTFTNVPDVPLTALGVTINGGPQALFTTTCAQPSANVTGAFAGQNGASATAAAPVTVTSCSSPGGGTPKPGAAQLRSPSLTGLAAGKAHLGFKLAAGNNGAPKLTGVTVRAPGGTSFVKAKLAKAVHVSGGKIKSLSLSGGKLVIKLRSAVSGFTVKVDPAALKVSASLRNKVKKHKTKTLKLSVGVAQADGTSSTLGVSVGVR